MVLGWHLLVLLVLLPVAILRQHYDAGYVIQFSRSEDFREIIAETTAKTNTPSALSLRKFSHGDCFWRVAAYNNRKGGRGSFSEPQKIELQ